MGPLNTASHGHGALAGSQRDIDYPILKTAQLFNMLDRLNQIDHTGKETDTTVYFQALLSRLRPYKNLVNDFLRGNLSDKTRIETLSKLFTQDIQKNIYKFLFDEVKKARIEEQRLQANKEKNSNDPVYEFIYNDMSDLEVAVMIARLRTLLDPSNGFLDNRQTPLSEDYLKNLRDLNSLEKVSAAIGHKFSR